MVLNKGNLEELISTHDRKFVSCEEVFSSRLAGILRLWSLLLEGKKEKGNFLPAWILKRNRTGHFCASFHRPERYGPVLAHPHCPEPAMSWCWLALNWCSCHATGAKRQWPGQRTARVERETRHCSPLGGLVVRPVRSKICLFSRLNRCSRKLVLPFHHDLTNTCDFSNILHLQFRSTPLALETLSHEPAFTPYCDLSPRRFRLKRQTCTLHRPRPPDIIRRPLLPILYSSFPPWPYTFAAPVFTLSQPQLGALDSFDPLFNTPSLASLVLLQT